MLKKLKSCLPTEERLKEHKQLARIYHLLHHQHLWHFNRRSVSKAVAIGLFCAFVPIPFQMILSAFIALYFRANLPISIALVWISNPITIPPLFYACYKIGCFLLQLPASEHDLLSIAGLMAHLSTAWQPFLLGCAFLSFTTSILGYFFCKLLWRLRVHYRWKHRH